MESCPKEFPQESVPECVLPNILTHLAKWMNSATSNTVDNKVLNPNIKSEL